MKSAFELALERTGGNLEEISEDKKAKLADIDAVYKAKIAEAELAAKDKLFKAGGDSATVEQIQQDLAVELASIKSKCEKEKDKIR